MRLGWRAVWGEFAGTRELRCGETEMDTTAEGYLSVESGAGQGAQRLLDFISFEHIFYSLSFFFYSFLSVYSNPSFKIQFIFHFTCEAFPHHPNLQQPHLPPVVLLVCSVLSVVNHALPQAVLLSCCWSTLLLLNNPWFTSCFTKRTGRSRRWKHVLYFLLSAVA